MGHAVQIRKYKEDNVTRCPLSLHPDSTAIILTESKEQTALISDGRATEQNPTCKSDGPPVLLPQQAVLVVQKEHLPPVFSPQIGNPLVKKGNLQSKDSFAKTPSSSRARNKPNCLRL